MRTLHIEIWANTVFSVPDWANIKNQKDFDEINEKLAMLKLVAIGDTVEGVGKRVSSKSYKIYLDD